MNRFILGFDLQVGQSILVDGHPQLITAVEPEILGVMVASSGKQSFLINPSEAVELVS